MYVIKNMALKGFKSDGTEFKAVLVANEENLREA